MPISCLDRRAILKGGDDEMAQLEVRLETVTPLFLGGSNPRGAPELRAASFRGVLRFWLRALLGGVLGDRNLDDLRKAEAAVFGSTEAASPVVVRIQSQEIPMIPFSQLAEWDPGQRAYQKPGIAYLFFAARETQQEPERRAVQAGTSFQLILSERAGVSAKTALRQAYAALWLLTHLGGLGARARRGAGGVQATQVQGQPEELPPLTIQATSPKRLQEELRDGLKKLRSLISSQSSGKVSNPSAFDILHPDVCKIWVINRTFDSWDEALDTIGQAMQQFRNRREPDYSNVKNAVQKGAPLKQPVERAAFGLPIVFYYRSLGDLKGTLKGSNHDRRASPLVIRVVRLANNRFTLVLTQFYAELLPPSERLLLERGRGSTTTAGLPNLGLIDAFLKELEQKIARRLEVTGW